MRLVLCSNVKKNGHIIIECCSKLLVSTDADVERARRLVQSPGRATMRMLRESDRRATNGRVTGARPGRPARHPWTTEPLRARGLPLVRCDAMRCASPVHYLLSSSTAPLFDGWQRWRSRAPSRLLPGKCLRCFLVDPASSDMLVSKLSHACLSISTCTVKLGMAH